MRRRPRSPAARVPLRSRRTLFPEARLRPATGRSSRSVATGPQACTRNTRGRSAARSGGQSSTSRMDRTPRTSRTASTTVHGQTPATTRVGTAGGSGRRLCPSRPACPPGCAGARRGAPREPAGFRASSPVRSGRRSSTTASTIRWRGRLRLALVGPARRHARRFSIWLWFRSPSSRCGCSLGGARSASRRPAWPASLRPLRRDARAARGCPPRRA